MGLKIDGQAACIMMTVTCGLSYLLYGYDQGFMSGVLLVDQFLDHMGHPSSFTQGLLASLYTLGAFIGSVFSMTFTERLGRKTPILIGTCLIIIGATIQTASYSQAQFIVGRIVAGCGTGLNTSIIPVWQAETLPAKKRESFGSMQYVLVCTGASISYWMSYALSYASNGEFEWRFAVAAQLIFAIFTLIFVPLMPESPRWLFLHNQTEESISILTRMHGTADPNNDEVQKELKLINQAVEIEEMNNASKWTDLFKNKSETQNLRRVMLGWWLMFMVMWSGVCSIGYYISYLFETSVGLSHNLSLLLSGFNGLWYLVSAILPPLIISRLGKRTMLMTGALGMGCCFLAMSLTIRSGTYGASIVCVIAFFLYYTFFALGFLAIPWLYNAEILPLHLRARGAAITTSSNWLWNFATVMMTPSVMGDLGWKGYLIFTVLNFAFVPVIFCFYPETTGRRLEEIDAIFYKTSAFVAFTECAKMGHFEADHLDSLVMNLENTKTAAMNSQHVESFNH
ncbi:Sugar transporter STL1 [Talaromyces islandicus]|uniref:Sugar transporter STL1 n=1 Tax=Talaromyces islandicus TaxID=28573 RepID=A0A0U1M6X2_TALIS|nr:Sugar transporter STL1 [Talaromyces islandicus]